MENPITRKNSAILIIEKENRFLQDTQTRFYVAFLISLLGLIIAALYIYKESTSKIRIQSLLDRNQHILDSQRSIILISDGRQIIESNRSLLEFYKLPDLETFREEYKCVCQTFIHDDALFSLDKVKEGENWIEVMSNLPRRERIIGIKTQDLEIRYFSVFISPINQNFIVTLDDITSDYLDRLSVLDESLHDPLTGSFNRKYFYDILPTKLESLNKELAVIFIDIDHFKKINDTHGHDCGDKILKEVAGLIDASIRQQDWLIRWGGEEFLLLIPMESASENSTTRIVENLRRKIAEYKFNQKYHVTCSFGMTFRHSNEDIESTIRRADIALYEAKDSGRNTVVSRWK